MSTGTGSAGTGSAGTGSTAGGYTVLARRYRPQAFADVVGQEHVAQALRNAIRSNRVAHAYLFTGARGVGKTSTARILAKALNCPNAVDGDPCNECEICRGISVGQDVDVLEIDGASNRGIDDIRQLRANVNVRSMRTRFKIYIIDEVHMLTKEAFNALLKTLEEPPPNVKFVFCTTEPNKVPDTILSRCQRFDFGTIETFNIRLRLRQIAESEGVTVDDDAIELVARRAAGSMRDSQSIFDQLLAFGEDRIGAVDVHRLLGTASDERLIAVAAAWLNRSPAAAIDALHVALESGVQLGELTDQMLSYLRDLMVLAAGAEQVDLLSVAPGSRDILATQAKQWGLHSIVAAMQILSETKFRMQRTTCGRALVELAIVRISLQENLTSLDGLIEKLRSGEVSSPIPSGPPAPVSAVSPAAEKKNDLKNLPPAAVERPAPSASIAPEPAAAAPVAARPVDRESSTGGTTAETQTAIPPAAARESTQPHPARQIPEPLVENSDDMPEGIFNALRDESGTDSAAPPEPATEAPLLEFQPGNAAAIWTQLLQEMSDIVRSHARTASHTAIFMPNRLDVVFPAKYTLARRYCERSDVIGPLEQIAARLTGVPVRITVSQSDKQEPAPARTQEKPAAQNTRRRVYRPEEDEFVSTVMNQFSAQVVNVAPIAGDAGRMAEGMEH